MPGRHRDQGEGKHDETTKAERELAEAVKKAKSNADPDKKAKAIKRVRKEGGAKD